jgi:ribulose-phosphate 3-epimerase
MSSIVPTVTDTEANPHAYRTQIERLQPFAERIHIDLMDGDFAPTRSINPVQVWWPEGVTADIHIMFRRLLEHTETLVALGPNMVIIHAEAEGDLRGMMEHLQKLGIKAGVCLLKDTGVESAGELIEIADHVLLFSGDLGHFGGHADFGVLEKVGQVKAINPDAEIGWDGGAKEDNVKQLAEGGVDVINVGGAIQRAENPREAYEKLVSIITQ